MAEGKPCFRTIEATGLAEVRRQREPLALLARFGELPVSPRLTLVEVAGRWLAEFEAKATIGERRGWTLDFYGSRLRCHLLPRLASTEWP
jgi:hypothetical protein